MRDTARVNTSIGGMTLGDQRVVEAGMRNVRKR